MKFDNLTAYELIKEETLGDIQSKGYLLRHVKSGARVMLIENDDENKVFNIAFRTPPGDSTGVAHILEHSVLCGSKHFPLKDPFVELVKGSLNTFLNAMTFPDKTMYPVASCNDQDFQNLMHIYLDAVFFPNIYEREEIFRQEGWNYQLNDVEDDLTYNGVVYNEMKGVFSSADELLERKIMDSLFPDSPYGFESGGDPKCIPDLKYSEFLGFHSKYYHPSNSYIYLYGDMDMEEKLHFLDENYLSLYDAMPVDSAVVRQEAFPKMKEMKIQYPILDHEEEKDNTYLAYNTVIETSLDTQLCVAFQILDYALLSAPGAPLKQALLDAHIGKDVYGSYDDGIYQPFFTVVAKGANEEDKDRFLQVIRETLKGIAEKGIDEKAIAAGINYYEFRFREADYASYPKGLMYGLDVFASWLYDDHKPFDQLQLLHIYEELKAKIGTGYYEELIRKYLLENTHATYIMACPQKGMTEKEDQEAAKALQAYKETLSREMLEEMVEKTRHLKEYQDTPDSPEALSCIPMLKISDIRRKTEKLYNKEYWVGDTLVLHHDVITNGIGYLSLMFDVGQIPQEWMPYVGILKSAIGYLDTQHYTYGELFNEINANTGGIACGVEIFHQAGSAEDYRAVFGVRSKALYPKTKFVFSMITEMLCTSKIDDDKRLKEMIGRLKSRLASGLASAGHSSAVQRAASYTSPSARFQDETTGIGFYQFVEALDRYFDVRKEELKQRLCQLMQYLFRPENLSVSFTGDSETRKTVEKEVEQFKKVLHTEHVALDGDLPVYEVRNEGFMTAGQVQFVAQFGNFVKAGHAYTGALSILKTILSYDYLWMNIRVKGGAYGCMSGFKRNGEGYLVSYRDPNLEDTLQVYQGVPQYLREFTADEREMTKYIIGTISGKDVPRTPMMQGSISRTAYLMGVTEEMMQKERDQILDATAEDIRNLAPLIEAILNDKTICVIGAKEVIQSQQDLFKEVKHLVS